MLTAISKKIVQCLRIAASLFSRGYPMHHGGLGHAFTLIELLIAISIVGIIAVVAFVALDPARRFADARDSRRWSDATSILDALKLYQVDNVGAYPATVAALTPGTVYMIGTCGATSNCSGVGIKACTDRTIAAAANGVDIASALTGGTPAYLGAIPVSPNDPAVNGNWDSVRSGFYAIRNANGSLVIGACEGESASIPTPPGISVTK